jgi:hypothetical protein
MKTLLKITLVLLSASAVGRTQVVPTATGPSGPPLGGHLQVALRYSESVETSSELGNWQTISPSGELSYTNGKERFPFSVTYTGGYTFTLTGPGYSTGEFQRMLISQGFVNRKWNVNVSDNVSYLPQAPTLGFSGIPGTGEPIGGSGSAPSTTQSVLTLNTHVVNNNAAIQVVDNESHALSFQFGGTSNILRYPNNDGIDTDAAAANAGATWHLNGRNSITAIYAFSEFGYPDYGDNFSTETGTIGFQHQWTRHVSTQIAAGPEWISSINAPVQSGTGPSATNVTAPSSLTAAASASASYQLRDSSMSVFYTRTTNGGGGYLFGGEVDSVSGNLSKEFHKTLDIGLSAGYMRTSELVTSAIINATFGGAEATWRVGRYVDVFATYSALSQSSDAALPSNTVNGILQEVTFGVGYTPTRLHR